jgi:hypothetical protein
VKSPLPDNGFGGATRDFKYSANDFGQYNEHGLLENGDAVVPD